MSALGTALDALDEGHGTAIVDDDGRRAEVDVTDVDRLGVRVREVRVRHDDPRDITQAAHDLPDRLRALPERVEPVEVDERLGGARLRSVPRGAARDMFEVDVETDHTVIRRTRVDDSGRRVPEDFTLTREQLDQLVDQAHE